MLDTGLYHAGTERTQMGEPDTVPALVGVPASDRGGWRGKHSEPGAIPADLSRHNRLWANRSGRESSSVWGEQTTGRLN